MTKGHVDQDESMQTATEMTFLWKPITNFLQYNSQMLEHNLPPNSHTVANATNLGVLY